MSVSDNIISEITNVAEVLNSLETNIVESCLSNIDSHKQKLLEIITSLNINNKQLKFQNISLLKEIEILNKQLSLTSNNYNKLKFENKQLLTDKFLLTIDKLNLIQEQNYLKTDIKEFKSKIKSLNKQLNNVYHTKNYEIKDLISDNKCYSERNNTLKNALREERIKYQELKNDHIKQIQLSTEHLLYIKNNINKLIEDITLERNKVKFLELREKQHTECIASVNLITLSFIQNTFNFINSFGYCCDSSIMSNVSMFTCRATDTREKITSLIDDWQKKLNTINKQFS